MKTIKTITPAYDVSGGDKSFDGVPYVGSENLSVQVFYTGFNKNDNKIRLQESIGGDEYVDSVDENEAYIEVTLASTLTSEMINVSGFRADFIRVRFVEGTSGIGTISQFNFLME